MLEVALDSLQSIFSAPYVLGFLPIRLLYILAGVLLGLAVGLIPGMGGLAGLAILLPFTFAMDSFAAIALMMGLLAAASMSDTVTSVLYAVPGSTGSQATILDGHPMARQGKAGRAFGAAYSASMIGGIIGAIALALVVPVMRPIVLFFGAPEFFMMGVLGISMVGALSGKVPLKGIVVGALGLLVGMVGTDPQSGSLRWDFGSLYLWEGVPLVLVALGMYAVPEIVDLTVQNTSIAAHAKKLDPVWSGVRDTFRHWFLVLRSSALGVWLGAIPGLGAPVVDWFAYGQALQTEKGASKTFGKGDVRGVIAVEAATNSKEGGALIPTLAFGVPGSAGMALILGALLMHGIVPGPDMVTTNADVTYSFIWILVIANILGTALCLGLAKPLALVSRIPIGYLAPVLFTIIMFAAYQTSRSLADIWVLLFFAVLGWVMKRFRWPRPPLILGVVLSGLIENYLFISTARYGMSWISRPGVIGIAVIVVASLVFANRAKKKQEDMPAVDPAEDEHGSEGPVEIGNKNG